MATRASDIVLADWHDHGHFLEVDADGIRAQTIAG